MISGAVTRMISSVFGGSAWSRGRAMIGGAPGPAAQALLTVNADGRDVHQFSLGSDVLQSIRRRYGALVA
jgi:hypothetical protein